MKDFISHSPAGPHIRGRYGFPLNFLSFDMSKINIYYIQTNSNVIF